jgi:hypothetical protein
VVEAEKAFKMLNFCCQLMQLTPEKTLLSSKLLVPTLFCCYFKFTSNRMS